MNTADETEKEIEFLKTENRDLRLLLEAATRHSDRLESDLLEKIDAGESLFQVISKTIPVPFIITAKDNGRVLFANRHSSRIFGYPDKYFHGKTIRGLNPDNLLKILDEQGRVENFENMAKKADGTVFPVSLFSQPVVFNKQECILTVVYDLTERYRAEEEKLNLEKQIRQSQKLEAIGTFASGIAHDFNNILTAIFGYIQLARMKADQNCEIGKFLEGAMIAGNRAKMLIHQIQTFSREKEQGRRPFPINETIRETAEMVRKFIPSNVDIRVITDSGPSLIFGDSTQIHQVIMNLCSNANHELREKGGVIEITLCAVSMPSNPDAVPTLKPGDYVRITVKDNGPGIEKAILERIFEPFFTTKGPAEGSGLGLSVVHGIVRGHGGDVRVESEPGKGAAFHCYFPLVRKSGEFAEIAEPLQVVVGGRETILFVDDDQFILETYGRIFRNLGYNTVTQNNSTEALNLFRENPQQYDLVITDNIMPNMTGRTLAQYILKIRPDIPIILCTGNEDTDTSSDTGIMEVITKPFSLPQIDGIIRNLMEKEKKIG